MSRKMWHYVTLRFSFRPLTLCDVVLRHVTLSFVMARTDRLHVTSHCASHGYVASDFGDVTSFDSDVKISRTCMCSASPDVSDKFVSSHFVTVADVA